MVLESVPVDVNQMMDDLRRLLRPYLTRLSRPTKGWLAVMGAPG